MKKDSPNFERLPNKKDYAMKRTLITVLILIGSFALLTAEPALGGISGTMIAPSAEVEESGPNLAITTGYSMLYGEQGLAHIPFLSIALPQHVELAFAVDTKERTDLLLSAKWRFIQKKGTSFAAGLTAQLLEVSESNTFAVQGYVSSTFNHTLMDLPTKSSVMVGYSWKQGVTPTTNIDFAVGLETMIFPNKLKNHLALLLDFGNISYSMNPSAGEASDRGLVNVGLRIPSFKIFPSTFITFDLRALDLFDHNGRAVSVSTALTFKP